MVLLPSACPARSPSDGFPLEEVIAPYYLFVDAGHEVLLASPDGGMPPVRRERLQAAAAGSARFAGDPDTRMLLSDTLELERVFVEDFAAGFFLAQAVEPQDHPKARGLVEAFRAAGKPVGLARAETDPSQAPDVAGVAAAAAAALLEQLAG